jgi:hypothetical protein
VIWLGLRMLFADGRRSVVIFGITSVAVAIGGCLLALTLSVPSAMQARADRQAWQDGSTVSEASLRADSSYTTLMTTTARSAGGDITLVWVAPNGPNAPVFPGLSRNPREGEAFQSPALQRLAKRIPEFAQRYGPPTGTIGPASLSSPDTLMVVRHLSADRMPKTVRSVFTKFPTRSDAPQRMYAGGLIAAVSALAAVALVLPVVLLLSTLGRLQAAGRERRLAALRLTGATVGQICGLTVIEAGFAGLCGSILVWPLLRLILPWATYLSDDLRWFPSDLTPAPRVMAAVLATLPLLVVIPALLGLRQAAVTPLGAARRAVRVRFSKWRLVPPSVIGAAGMLFAAVGGVSRVGGSVTAAAAFGWLLMTFVLAGPLLMRGVGRLLQRGGGTVRLLAGGRIVADPRGAFRALVTIVLAIFVSTVCTALTPAAVAGLSEAGRSGLTTGVASASQMGLTTTQIDKLVLHLTQVPGVSQVTPVLRGTAESPSGDAGSINTALWIGDCHGLAPLIDIPATRCDEGDVLVSPAGTPLISANKTVKITNIPANRLPTAIGADPALTAEVRPRRIAIVPFPGGFDVPGIIVTPDLVPERVRTRARPDGLLLRFASPRALEQARSVFDRWAPGTALAAGAESENSNLDGAVRTRRALLLVSLMAFLVGGVGSAAFITTGVLERRREYALLRVSGVPLSVLRWSVLIETAGPMIASALIATVLGLCVALAIVGSSRLSPALGWAMIWPSLLGCAIALGPVFIVLVVLKRVTDTEETRFE